MKYFFFFHYKMYTFFPRSSFTNKNSVLQIVAVPSQCRPPQTAPQQTNWRVKSKPVSPLTVRMPPKKKPASAAAEISPATAEKLGTNPRALVVPFPSNFVTLISCRTCVGNKVSSMNLSILVKVCLLCHNNMIFLHKAFLGAGSKKIRI